MSKKKDAWNLNIDAVATDKATAALGAGLSHREEQFCYFVAQGMPPAKAYINSGGRGKDAQGEALKLMAKPHITNAIENLRLSQLEPSTVTKNDLIAWHLKAMNNPKISEANRLNSAKEVANLKGFSKDHTSGLVVNINMDMGLPTATPVIEAEVEDAETAD